MSEKILDDYSYLVIKTTVWIIRTARVPLTAEQDEAVKKFETALAEYERRKAV